MAGALAEDGLLHGLREAISRGYALVDRLALVHVHRPRVFHPSVAFTQSEAFVLVMELHPTLPTSIEWPLVSSMTEEIHGGSAKLPNALSDVLPCDVVVNSDLLAVLPETKARDVLAAFVRAITKDEAMNIEILVGHQGGYLGQKFDERSYRVTNVVQSTRQPDALRSLDAALESTMACIAAEAPSSNKVTRVQVMAGYMLFNIPWTLQPTVKVYSTWEGIENVSALGCKPPPLSASVICIGNLETLTDATLKDCFNDPFPVHFKRHLLFLEWIERSIEANGAALTLPWPTTGTAMDIKQLILEPDSILLSTLDAVDDPSHASTLLRPDMDLLEKAWHGLAYTAASTASVVEVVHELQSCFEQGSVLPLIHSHNSSELAVFLRQLVQQAQQQRYVQDASESFPVAPLTLLQDDASSLRYMRQVGIYKLQRDLTHWLGLQGIVLADLASFVTSCAHFKKVQWLVDVCAVGKLLGLNVAMIRQLAQDALAHAQAGTDRVPTFYVVYDAFLPDRLRSLLSEPFLWSLEMQLEDGFSRTLRMDDLPRRGAEDGAPFRISPTAAARLADAMLPRGTEARDILARGVAAFESTLAPTAQFYDCQRRSVQYPL
ncbi:hypothetical protein SPRG_01124 [Saprolegnia parasitica CBS 223.65]|uniref:Uncharacterized protein n=1 Tax=Saprolegnia parasitica (strain CBS 223.65) TaxID=695850 RepID=A0A067D0N2_SAPPC|nr:hypothetical protein SPRG_01124 [Saprolegnia parasitica CBS 223.65]KDO35060.1 hypothetical protein SPRG_01124 [Saprolegnia parasitica CBS 223.65]|eukprot:XP_012194713.1 hypothetical protein SPRG_01124 [Saprolegnia parasitica CBS 223.65]